MGCWISVGCGAEASLRKHSSWLPPESVICVCGVRGAGEGGGRDRERQRQREYLVSKTVEDFLISVMLKSQPLSPVFA